MVWFSISLNHCSRDAGTVLFVPRETQGRSFEHDGVAGVVREIRMMHTVVETFDGNSLQLLRAEAQFILFKVIRIIAEPVSHFSFPPFRPVGTEAEKGTLNQCCTA